MSKACSKEFFSLIYLKFIFSYRKKISFKSRLDNLIYKQEYYNLLRKVCLDLIKFVSM